MHAALLHMQVLESQHLKRFAHPSSDMSSQVKGEEDTWVGCIEYAVT